MAQLTCSTFSERYQNNNSEHEDEVNKHLHSAGEKNLITPSNNTMLL